MRRLLLLAGATLLLGAAGPRGERVILATPPSGTETTVHLVAPGAGELGAPVARFEHAPWASVQAALAGDEVVAVVDREDNPDRSFASGLVRITPDGAGAWLAGGVVVASRPHPLPGGKVLVARGRAGVDRGDGSTRIDQLSVDEIDLAGGGARTIHAGAGYLLYVAGVTGGEALIYRVGPAGADVVAVALADGRVRPLVDGLPGYARDFTVEDGALVFLDRHETDGRRWLTWRLDLATGARRVIGEGTRASRGLSARARVALPSAPGLRLTVAAP